MDPDDIVRLFQRKKTVIVDHCMLNRQFYPATIVARDEQVQEIAQNLFSIMERCPANNMLITGTNGSGKTVVVDNVIDVFNKNLKLKYPDILVETETLFCDVISTVHLAVTELLSKLSDNQVKTRGYSAERYLADFVDLINAKAKEHLFYSLIIILDFPDECKDYNEFLRTFLKLSSLLDNAAITIIAITDDENFFKTLDQQVVSKALFKHIKFPNYTEEDLFKILLQKKGAFEEGSLPDDVIRCCAKITAEKYRGDARHALTLLNDVGHDVLSGNVIKTDNVIEAEKRYDPDEFTIHAVEGLALFDKLMLAAVNISNEVLSEKKSKTAATTGVVVAVFQKICELLGEKSFGTSFASSKVTGLAETGFIEATRPKRRGNTRYVTLTYRVQKQVNSLFSAEQSEIINANRKVLEAVILENIR